MGMCREIYQEGFRIPPVKLMRAGQMDRDVLNLFLPMCAHLRSAKATWARRLQRVTPGRARLLEICRRYGLEARAACCAEFLEYSEEMMRAFLARFRRDLSRRRFPR